MSSVLVVDDNPTHANLAAKLVGKAKKVDTRVFNDPFLALNDALENPPDLVITDVMMPKIDGVSLVREMRKAGLKAPVIIMTAYSTKVTLRLLPSNNVMAVLQKPFNVKDFFDAVDKVPLEEVVQTN